MVGGELLPSKVEFHPQYDTCQTKEPQKHVETKTRISIRYCKQKIKDLFKLVLFYF